MCFCQLSTATFPEAHSGLFPAFAVQCQGWPGIEQDYLYLRKLSPRKTYMYTDNLIIIIMFNLIIFNCGKINIKFNILTILSIQFCGIKYIHIIAQQHSYLKNIFSWIK